MTCYVEVSFPDPIGEGTLTYHLPPGRDVPLIGCRVVVPVQNRRLIGYITRIHSVLPTFRTVALGEVLDPLPLFSPAMLELAAITANDCACNIGEVLHAMLPGGIKQKIVRMISATADSDDSALHWLYEHGQTPYNSFIEAFPRSAGQLKDWLDSGFVEILHSITTNAGPRLIKVLKLNPQMAVEPEKLTPKERQAVQALLACSSAPTAAQLCRAASISSAPINQLKKKGLLLEVEERVMRQVADADYYRRPAEVPPELSDDQQKVLAEIKDAYATDRKPVLVRGVTCSGKTEVYLRWVAEIISMNRTAIVLVPEISLTPQMMKRFTDRFQSQVAILHSKLSDGERFDQWEKIRRGVCPVVVGARSAVFAPLPRLGTIILDEEGEPSFKQGDSPRYHAREVANHRCRIENAQLVMGSATPTIDSFYQCSTGACRLVEMNSRVSDRRPPLVKVVDMRHELVARKNRSIFSQQLGDSIKKTLAAHKQVILYLNRRGYSSFVFCRECGKAVECPKCNVSLVYHTGSQIMRCHYCSEIQTVPETCPACGSRAIKFFGAGTQRVESEAKRYFPTARIQRLDSDSVSTKGSMEEILDRFGRGEIDILVGTQMVAKGLDFPNVTLVGILAADSLLRLPDFRASERNFSLLAQVSGRAGRGDSPGEVILQTYYPEHHSIQFALTEDYHGFYTKEAQLRHETLFPPYMELASFIVSATDKKRAADSAKALHDLFAAHPAVDASLLLGPAPAAIEKINDRYRFQLLLKMSDFEQLTRTVREVCRQLKKPGDTRLSIDINPCFML
ncbi:MAG: Helicase PriA essential for oriC/DnaA-independent DNA replication [Candidatus Rifleibacterium amylolyticum]|nr:MAG: Helicase PriA essential for oriC/DnaA-independent DNA replication [Candidatus Rifleibacterium amylolyticum]NLF96721.1 primosomal protein N' [Candidatus Riflebacteria bacterium]